ncbi:MAG: metal-dependent hydrolase [Elusimicrobiota bacterium]|nr:metal-dependent hydrolase [Elusimicrobiota bacterium]
MDPVTHTLLGLAVGETFFKSRLGSRALWVSAVAANLPDIDTVVLLTGDPSAVILRRSFGHSLALLPLWIAGLTWIFKRKYEDLETSDLAVMITAGCAGHLLFDLINSFGVQLLWPFSTARPEIGAIFIIDLALAGFLAAPHLARLKASWRPALGGLSGAALVAVAFYLALALSARQLAAGQLAEQTGGRGFQYVFPEPLGAHRWRGVVKEPGAWRTYLIDVSKRTAVPGPVFPDDAMTAPALAAKDTAFGRRLMTFFKAPVWTVEARPDGGAVVSVQDLRFVSLVLPRENPFRYEFDAPRGGEAEPRRVKIW